MKKIKVLYIITKSDIGGAQKYINDLAANLDKKLFETRILYGGKDIKWLSNKLYPWFLFFNDWMAIFELVKIFKRERPNIIHLNSSKTGVIGSIAAYFHRISCRISHVSCPKVIFTAHGWVFNPTNYISKAAKFSYIALHKFAGMLQDTIINVSQYDKSIALAYKIAPEYKLAKIYNGIDPNISFLDRKIAREEIKKKLETGNCLPAIRPGRSRWQAGKLEINRPWIGSVGRLTKEKNYETLIGAAAKIPNAFFFIIGEGPELYNLQRTTYNLQLKERFFFVRPNGYDAKFLKMFDVFVMSSVKEGFPYILLEAMAAELPIVITKTGGMPEAIEHEKTGLIVEQKNPRALGDAIETILLNKEICKKFKREAKEKSKQAFNLDRMVKATEQIYLM